MIVGDFQDLIVFILSLATLATGIYAAIIASIDYITDEQELC